jgi:protease II
MANRCAAMRKQRASDQSASSNIVPDFAAILAGVPFVDVVNTMQDSSIAWTEFEYSEW